MVRKINTFIWQSEFQLVLIHLTQVTARVYVQRIIACRASSSDNECFRWGMETIAPSTEFIKRHTYEIQIIYLCGVNLDIYARI